jgi:hypothetical protein
MIHTQATNWWFWPKRHGSGVEGDVRVDGTTNPSGLSDHVFRRILGAMNRHPAVGWTGHGHLYGSQRGPLNQSGTLCQAHSEIGSVHLHAGRFKLAQRGFDFLRDLVAKIARC